MVMRAVLMWTVRMRGERMRCGAFEARSSEERSSADSMVLHNDCRGSRKYFGYIDCKKIDSHDVSFFSQPQQFISGN